MERTEREMWCAHRARARPHGGNIGGGRNDCVQVIEAEDILPEQKPERAGTLFRLAFRLVSRRASRDSASEGVAIEDLGGCGGLRGFRQMLVRNNDVARFMADELHRRAAGLCAGQIEERAPPAAGAPVGAGEYLVEAAV